MKQNNIFAIIETPDKAPEIKLIDKNIKMFNSLIDGKREVIPFPSLPAICVVFDGAAVESKKKPNCHLPEYEDLILGTAIFVAISIETGFTSLSEDQADKLLQYLKTNDAKGFSGNIEDKIRREYLSPSEDNFVFEYLSEIKTKYKTMKVNWLSKR